MTNLKNSEIGIIRMIAIIILITSCTRKNEIYVPPLVSGKASVINAKIEKYYRHRSEPAKYEAAKYLVDKFSQ